MARKLYLLVSWNEDDKETAEKVWSGVLAASAVEALPVNDDEVRLVSPEFAGRVIRRKKTARVKKS